MKILKILLFMMLTSCSQMELKPKIAGLKLEFTYSKAVSYLHFLDSGFSDPKASKSVKELIKKNNISYFKNPEIKKLFKLFKSYLRKGYNFSSRPSRPRGVFGEDVLISLAANSSSLEQFEKSLSIVLPYDGIEAYFSLKKYFFNSFQKIMWEPTVASQAKNLRNINEIVETTKFRLHLNKARRFYRSNYPKEVPLKVSLIAIPDNNLKNKHTRAMNLRDIQIVPYLASRGAQEHLDIVFHEFCHAFFEGQSLVIQKQMEQFYLNNSEAHSVFVYRYLNEALATAWGNGWYAELKNGQQTTKPWYSVHSVDSLAREYLPLIKKYTEKGKLIDKNFMTETVEIAKSRFPQAPSDLKGNMMALKVLLDNKNISIDNVSALLKKKFRIHWMSRSSPVIEKDWQELLKNPFYTTLVISSDNDKSYKVMKEKMGDIEFSKDEDFMAIIPKQNKYFLWINSKKPGKVYEALKRLENKKHFEKTTEVLRI